MDGDAAALPAERRRLFDLFARHYEHVSWSRFEADLAEKDVVVLLHDVIAGDVRGFSTQKIIRAVVDFAKSRHKQLSIPEWGVGPIGGSTQSAGDDPAYVRGIASVVRENRGCGATLLQQRVADAVASFAGGEFQDDATLSVVAIR